QPLDSGLNVSKQFLHGSSLQNFSHSLPPALPVPAPHRVEVVAIVGHGAEGQAPLPVSVPFLIAEPPESLRYGGFLVTPGPRPFRVLAHLGPGGFLRRVLGRGEGVKILVGKAG